MRSALGMGCLLTCLAFPTAKKCFWKNVYPQNQKQWLPESNSYAENHGIGLAYNKPLSRFLTHSTIVVIPSGIPTQLLSSPNRSNLNAFQHILPRFSPFCESLHYNTTDLPWQMKSIFIIILYPFISLQIPAISGFLALSLIFSFSQNLRKSP